MMLGRSIVSLVSLALLSGSPEVPPAGGTSAVSVGELLASGRGVAPALCALAADGISSGRWGGGWGPPAQPLGADVRRRIRALRVSALSPEEVQATVGSLGSADACERQLGAAILGNADDKSLAEPVGRRLASASSAERVAALVALGTMGASSQTKAIVGLLEDASADVRANAVWALGRIDAHEAAPAVSARL
jgi:hypothetical protein